MADKILPQRVSAFHSSLQPAPYPLLLCPPFPTPFISPPPSGTELQRCSHFHFLFKKLIKK